MSGKGDDTSAFLSRCQKRTRLFSPPPTPPGGEEPSTSGRGTQPRRPDETLDHAVRIAARLTAVVLRPCAAAWNHPLQLQRIAAVCSLVAALPTISSMLAYVPLSSTGYWVITVALRKLLKLAGGLILGSLAMSVLQGQTSVGDLLQGLREGKDRLLAMVAEARSRL